MELKKIAVIGSIVTTLGFGGVVGYTDLICLDPVNIKTNIGVKKAKFCGEELEYSQLKTEIKKRFNENSLVVGKDENGEGVSDYVSAVLVARNDQVFYDEIREIGKGKYNIAKKEFDGSKFDHDFKEQLAFFTELANIKCGGVCNFSNTENLSEEIYNIIK